LIDFEYAQKPVGLLNYPCPWWLTFFF
jgi:hypothetical protein